MKKNTKISIILILVTILILMTGIGIYLIPKKQVELTQLSSQTGDRMMGYVIRTDDDKTIVIDGGMSGDAENLVNNVKKYENKIDLWIITHPHKDHVGAFVEIVNNNTDLKIDKVYYSANELEWYKTISESERFEEVENFYKAIENDRIKSVSSLAKIGDKLEISENINIEVLGINNPEITQNPINNSSMVFKLFVNRKSILFLGDIGVEASDKLIKIYGEKLKSDIVQVSHHGQAGATEEFYKLVNPDICLWPTPEWLWNNDNGGGYNSGNWKTLETRQWFENIGVKEHYIAKDGDITITIK